MNQTNPLWTPHPSTNVNLCIFVFLMMNPSLPQLLNLNQSNLYDELPSPLKLLNFICIAV